MESILDRPHQSILVPYALGRGQAFMNLALRKIGFSPLRKLSVSEGQRNSTNRFRESITTICTNPDSSQDIGA